MKELEELKNQDRMWRSQRIEWDIGEVLMNVENEMGLYLS